MKVLRMLLLAAMSVSLAGCVLNEETFNANRAALRNRPDIQASGLARCERQVKYSHIEFKRQAAIFVRAKIEDLQQAICGRLLRGYLGGRMQYADFKALVTGQKFTPGMIRVLRSG